MNRIGIVGGGISGLTLANHVSRSIKLKAALSFVTAYESNGVLGGRVRSEPVVDQLTSKQYIVDYGPNLIDFENESSFNSWETLLPFSVINNMRLFKRPFLIYENQKLRKADYQKNRYYYVGGFSKMINDITNSINSGEAEILCNHEVQKIELRQKSVILTVHDKMRNKITEEEFSKVYLTIPPPVALPLLKKKPSDPNSEMRNLINYCRSIKYTKQLSVGFPTKEGSSHNFSSVLCKKHPVLTFICSHQEKYFQNSIVVQTSEEFSEKYFNEPDDMIADLVFDSLPNEIMNLTMDHSLGVKRWTYSLLKPTKDVHPAPKGGLIQFVGDCLYGKSSLSNSIQSLNRVISRL